MRVPYPYSHPKYDPNKIRPSRESDLFSPFSSNRLPTFTSSQESRVGEIRARLSNYDYRYSAAFSEYEKCLLLPLTSNNPGEFNTCNLTQFIEIEKQKLANKHKFYEELSLNDIDTILNNHRINQVESYSLTILIFAGIFGGIFMLLFLFIGYLSYLHFIKKKPLSWNIFQQHLQSQQEQILLQQSHQLNLDSKLLEISTSQNFISQYKNHNLEIFHEYEIGRGSNGTVVFRGLFEGRRHVAVKKMVARFHHFER